MTEKNLSQHSSHIRATFLLLSSFIDQEQVFHSENSDNKKELVVQALASVGQQ